MASVKGNHPPKRAGVWGGFEEQVDKRERMDIMYLEFEKVLGKSLYLIQYRK